MTVRLLLGDCRDVLRTLADASVDSVVTDPPYHLTQASRGGHARTNNPEMPHGRHRIGDKGFMGKVWDGGDVAFRAETWAEVLRVLKPGGHLVAFGGTRTYHRMVCAIEDAGFEVRDQLGWMYGSGFPKSLDVSKAIDKAAGAEREFTPVGAAVKRMIPGADQNATGSWVKDNGREYQPGVSEPATDAARQWQGWGTALKPAWEPIVMARRPLVGTVAANVLQHGTGALNIDGCRVGETVETWLASRSYQRLDTGASSKGTQATGEPPPGRWPANILHDGSDEVVALFPSEAGAQAPVTVRNGDKFRGTYGAFKGNRDEAGSTFKGDSGSAARFFGSFPEDAQCNPSSAGTAPASSSLRSSLVSSVQSAAAIWPALGGIASSDWAAVSTNVTEIESRALCEAVITAMASIGSEFSRESRHERRTPCGSLVSVAVTREPTGITTTTASLWRSGGFAEAVTLSITPTPLDLGAADFARFNYCAKADRADRNEGLDGMPSQVVSVWGGDEDDLSEGKKSTKPRANHHPTVKPTDLMRWLCRLVTPPGGTVLDPFMGSGSTLKAAELEGFSAIGIEREAEYIAIARRRIAADAPLFAEVSA